jgi:hypothetical protein
VQSVYHCKWCFYNSEFIAGKSQAQPSSCGVLSFINTVFSGSRHKPHARCHDNVHVQVSDAMVQSIRCVRRQLRAHACSFYSQDAIWESRKESTCELIWPVPCSLKECTECPSNQETLLVACHAVIPLLASRILPTSAYVLPTRYSKKKAR